MRVIYGLAALAVFTASVSANAATYIGTLHGIITGGSAQYSTLLFDPGSVPTTIPLVGKDITIDFTSNVTLNYNDPVNMVFYPKYVVNSVNVTIGIPAPLGNYGSVQANDLYTNPYGSADFSGNAANGNLSIGGPVGDIDFRQYVDFTFANAKSIQGPLSGNGTGSISYFVPFTGEYDSYGITFNLLNGVVNGPGSGVPLGTPEPATWAMMVLGFGAVGAGMRKRQRVSNPYAE